jgi:hypothetical protein
VFVYKGETLLNLVSVSYVNLMLLTLDSQEIKSLRSLNLGL